MWLTLGGDCVDTEEDDWITAAKRATQAQILEDAGRVVVAWNERQAKRMLMSPTRLR